MNKLANTYLDAVDSLLAIHRKSPMPNDWDMIVDSLTEAVRAINEDRDPTAFRDDWTPADNLLGMKQILPKEPAQRENPAPKPLTIYHLRRQVDAEISKLESHFAGMQCRWIPTGETEFVWTIGDFEIRRRK